MPASSQSFPFLVDGVEIAVSENAKSLRFVFRLTSDQSQLPRLAEYAAGRMLRESAVLSCDDSGAFLWREVGRDSDASWFRKCFEDFVDSCDWWRARIGALPGDDAAPEFHEMVIRP